MAKTESTAVNDLIALVNQPPLLQTPSEELQFDGRQRPAVASSVRPASRLANSASMTPSSATVAPLPRSRAPHGTASNLVPPRRSTALPPPRPSAQMAVPHISASIAEPSVAPVAARVAWPFPAAEGPRTEPIEQIELSLDDDNVDNIDAIAFDDDEIAFDGDPDAPVPTSVMAQNEIDRLADQSVRAVADMARLDEGWTPNRAAPLTLDDHESDFAISETSPFLHDKNQAVLDDAAVQAVPAQLPRAASAPVLAMAPLPRPRATSPVPVHARPSAVHGVPQLPQQLQTAHLNPASLPQLPRASGISWPTDFGPTVSPSEAAVVEVGHAQRVDVAPLKANIEVTPPKKFAAALPLAAGLAVVGLFAGGYLYFNNQTAAPVAGSPVATSPVASQPNAAASPASAVIEAEPATVAPTAGPTAVPATDLGAATAPIALEPATPATANHAVVEPAAIAVATVPTEAAPNNALTNIPTTTEPAIAIPAPLPTVPQLAVVGAYATPASASLVDVRFESKPPGATVTLVDRGRTSLIGTTPISAALDSTYKYEIVFSLDGRATQIAKLDPKKSQTIKSILPATSSRHSTNAANDGAAVAVANKPTTANNKPPADVITQPRVTTKPAAPGRAASTSEVAAVFGPASQATSGIVMISSKPPCEIVIDGKATGLMTPQRNLTMTAGPHTVTLLNKPNGIKKVLSVQVTAGKSTKLVQDYTALIKN